MIQVEYSTVKNESDIKTVMLKGKNELMRFLQEVKQKDNRETDRVRYELYPATQNSD